MAAEHGGLSKNGIKRSEIKGMWPYLCFSSSLCDDLKDRRGMCVTTLEAPEKLNSNDQRKETKVKDPPQFDLRHERRHLQKRNRTR